jgi:3-oxoacid CoA-transferase B subunit
MPWSDEELAQLVADDIEEGWVVNLGIGLPTQVAKWLEGREVLVHAENGIVGIGAPARPGEEDEDIVNPGKQYATLVAGGAFMDSALSFALMRGGRLDLAIVGAYQVSYDGDLANWRLPNTRLAGIGGAADLAVGAQRMWVMTKLFSPDGSPKLMSRCTFELTARGVVDRVYTDHGVFFIGGERPRVIRTAPDIDASSLAWADPVPA